MESRQFTRKKPVYPQRTGRHTRQIAHQAIRTLSDTVLAGIAQRRADGVLNPEEQSIREEILFGLLVDKGGEAQISTAMRVLAKIHRERLSLLVTFNHAIDGVIQNNRRPEPIPKHWRNWTGTRGRWLALLQ